MSQSYRHALITGASAGLGAEFARQLAGRVDRLTLVARRQEKLEEVAEALRAKHAGLEVVCLSCDLSLGEERVALSEKLEGEGIDLLINNAGLGDYGEFTASEWEKMELMLQVNVVALTHVLRLFLPGLALVQSGSVLNVSSLASTLPIADFASYAATKAYVSSLTEAVRIECESAGVKLCALCPGPVHTEFGEVAKREGGEDFATNETFFVPKEQVVAEGLEALEKGKARVFPGWQVKLAAAAIGLMPMWMVRMVMRRRPRKG